MKIKCKGPEVTNLHQSGPPKPKIDLFRHSKTGKVKNMMCNSVILVWWYIIACIVSTLWMQDGMEDRFVQKDAKPEAA